MTAAQSKNLDMLIQIQVFYTNTGLDWTLKKQIQGGSDHHPDRDSEINYD